MILQSTHGDELLGSDLAILVLVIGAEGPFKLRVPPVGFGAPAGRRRRQVAYFFKDNALTIGSNVKVLKNLLDVWNGAEAETHAANERYAAIMKHCRGGKNEKPQISWFIDPIALATSATSQSPRAQIGLALLPTLGLDGLHGLGGTVALATESSIPV